MKKTNEKRNNLGFSLVELIVVIAIMAVLVGVLAPQFIRYVEKSRESTDIQNIQQMMTAVETYNADLETPVDVVLEAKTGATGIVECSVPVAMTNNGLKASTKLKSSHWGVFKFTYSAADNSWTATTGTNKGADAKTAPYYDLDYQLGLSATEN